MSTVTLIFWASLFAASCLCLSLVFVLYPLSLAIIDAVLGPRQASTGDSDGDMPFVSLITVARNAEGIISSKIRNARELDYPADRYEIIVYSDGSEDGTEKVVKSFDDPRIRLYSSGKHRGKANGLNQAVEQSRGDILVFSDVDASLNRDALGQLIRHHTDPDIGGVCGKRVVGPARGTAVRAQSSYVEFDSTIKRLESVRGSLTSNDGKIYSVRRDLFRPITPGTSDDLDCCLNVVEQGKRFVYEPAARAVVPVPSKDLRQEIQRRRRIVCGSLKTILSHPRLFNPLAHGTYGIRLGINKVLRRLLPMSLLLVLISTLALWDVHAFFPAFAGIQGLGYGAAAVYPLLPRPLKSNRIICFLPETAFYFCAGNAGSLLGLWDYIVGRRYVVWEPTRRGEPKT